MKKGLLISMFIFCLGYFGLGSCRLIRDPFYVSDQSPNDEKPQRIVKLVGIIQCDGKRRAVVSMGTRQNVVTEGMLLFGFHIDHITHHSVTLVRESRRVVVNVGQVVEVP